MKLKPAIILLTLVTGCATVPSDSAVCDALRGDVSGLAGAVADDGGPRSVVAVDNFLTRIEAGCGW